MKRISTENSIKCFAALSRGNNHAAPARHLRPRCDEVFRCIVLPEEFNMRINFRSNLCEFDDVMQVNGEWFCFGGIRAGIS